MIGKKNLLLVCVAGFATTSLMKREILEGLSKQGVDIDQINIQVETISNILNYIDQTDLIITTLSLEESEYNVPIINGISLLTGINSIDVIDKIIKGLNLETN